MITFEHNGETFTVNPADFPAEHVWLCFDGVYSVCRHHRVVFDVRASGAGCAECYRAPKMPSDIERPDYWRAMPGMPGKYECEYHPGVLCFEADEACKRCLKEDLEATPGSKVGNADRSGPGTLRADLSPTETGAP